jgi:hypothetical protein
LAIGGGCAAVVSDITGSEDAGAPDAVVASAVDGVPTGDVVAFSAGVTRADALVRTPAEDRGSVGEVPEPAAQAEHITAHNIDPQRPRMILLAIRESMSRGRSKSR